MRKYLLPLLVFGAIGALVVIGVLATRDDGTRDLPPKGHSTAGDNANGKTRESGSVLKGGGRETPTSLKQNRWLSELERALEREELFLHFQPQVSLQSGNIVGVEALVRWLHPEMGLVSPAKFIPLAEENGLIGVIGKWVLHTACAQAKAWQNDGLTPVRIAVNLSGRQLERINIVQEVDDVLKDTGLDPCYLELELTESSVMKRAERAVKTLDVALTPLPGSICSFQSFNAFLMVTAEI